MRYTIKGFSLIELSIVLIIISLLVAGITGSVSLIKNAKIMSIINQLKDWEMSVYTFKTTTDRLPGDINNNGKIGYVQEGVAYTETEDVCNACGHYTGEYANKNVGTVAGPWVDLYLAKLITFKPNPTSSEISTVYYPKKSQINVILPVSKLDPKNAIVYFNYKIVLELSQRSESDSFDASVLEIIDKKIDDGKWEIGDIISSCGDSADETYKTFIDNEIKCNGMYYYLSI